MLTMGQEQIKATRLGVRFINFHLGDIIISASLNSWNDDTYEWNSLLAPSGCYFDSACSLVAPCTEVTEAGDINGNIMCWCFGMIIARCDTDGKSSRTRKMHLFWLHSTHTHTQARACARHELGKVRGRQQRGNMERQWRGKTTTQIAAGRDAAEYIFDEWMACCTLSTLLILMARAGYNKSMLRQVLAR